MALDLQAAPPQAPAGPVLGIDGGGTKTTWALVAPDGTIMKAGTAGPGNTLLLNDRQLAHLLKTIRQDAGSDIFAIGAAFAGCQVASELDRTGRAIRNAWPTVETVIVGEDTASALAGALGDANGICVIAGTGSNVIGRHSGRLAKAGGRGHIFSDEGSAYDIVRRGLRAVYYTWDQKQQVTLLGQILLRQACRNSLDDLVAWVLNHSTKRELASLCPCVFEAARAGDRQARTVIHEGAESLAERVVLVGRRLKLRLPTVALFGGLFEKQPDYETAFRRALYAIYPGSKVILSRTPPALGAAAMVFTQLRHGQATAPAPPLPPSPPDQPVPATEAPNPRSKGLHTQSTAELVRLFLDEEKHVEKALRSAEGQLVAAADLVAARLAEDGRLFYVGAGTSGRLGILDASEMPPTFNAPAGMVQGIIAGGAPAVFNSQEGAEDNTNAGATAIRQRGVTQDDVVVGIAASGTTPFVLAALQAARQLDAATILVTCNPHHPPCPDAQLVVVLPTGPEIIAGSSRLKAGTATKVALNLLSTIAMIRQGRVYDNLMIDVQPTNQKLRRRAVGLVTTILGCPEADARSLLEEHRWSVRAVIQSAGK